LTTSGGFALWGVAGLLLFLTVLSPLPLKAVLGFAAALIVVCAFIFTEDGLDEEGYQHYLDEEARRHTRHTDGYGGELRV
jgi:hypothetical protein